ncbi:DUF5753 domain-containing protein [Actinomadura scrupuli]|uniref:DUF5753 domain-containing protein n=1 Tax=Actinomadura scrupuli TaxID=559629 RepID=UPI003D972D99
MSLAEVGQLVNLTRGSVSNIEAARPGHKLNEGQAAKLDEQWNLNGHFARLVRYARNDHDPDWAREHLGYEARATTMKISENMFVPGLFQTPDYARALLLAARRPDVPAGLEDRMARQAVLTRDTPPEIWAHLDEAALDRPVGGPAMMRAQLARLLEVTELPQVTVRVVPKSAGAHVGMEGPFKILSVEEGDVVYVETCGAGRLIRDPAEVRAFGLRFDRIGAETLARNPTRDLIARVMATLT